MAIEDFLDGTWIEVDPNNHISRTSSRVTATDLTRGESAYVYKDEGAGYFSGDFEHKLDICLTARSDYAEIAFYGLVNVVNDFENWKTIPHIRLSVFMQGVSPYANRMWMVARDTAGNQDGDYYDLTVGTTYYLTIKRNGLSVTFEIYSDAARTILLKSYSTTALTDVPAFQYIYVIASRTYSGTQACSGYTENLDLVEYTISGVTRDSAGNPLGNCVVWLFRASDKIFQAETTSDANGNYSFTVPDTSTEYFIRAHKDGTPNVFGTTDDNLTGS